MGNMASPTDTNQNQAYYIGDGMTNNSNKFKVSSDAIVYNGESLGDENSYIGTQNYAVDNDYSVDSTPVKMFGGPMKSHNASMQSRGGGGGGVGMME